MHTSGETPIITSGASLGALHAANMFSAVPIFSRHHRHVRRVRPDNLHKRVLQQRHLFNSPCHYLPNLTDENVLNRLRNSGRIHILSGSGDYEDPEASRNLSGILNGKGIGHHLDIWGGDIRHDWPTWRSMLPYVIDQKF